MKKAKRFRLTKAAKILIMILIVALIGGGIFAGVQTGMIQTKKDKSVSGTTTSETVAKTESTSNNEDDDKKNTVKKDEAKTADDNVINVSLDEWIG